MGIILQQILTNTIIMKLFKRAYEWVKSKFKKKRLMHVDVPMTCSSRAEKKRIIKATKLLLEQTIIIL